MGELRKKNEDAKTKNQTLSIHTKAEKYIFPNNATYKRDPKDDPVKSNYLRIPLNIYKVHCLPQNPIFPCQQEQGIVPEKKNPLFNDDLKDPKTTKFHPSKWPDATLGHFPSIAYSDPLSATFDQKKWIDKQETISRQLVGEKPKKQGKVMSHFSHSINSALATILSSIELLEIIDTSTTRKNKKHYTIIRSQAININHLVERFIALMKGD